MEGLVLTSVGVEANVRVEGASVTVEEAAVPVEYILLGPGERRKNELRLAFLSSERLSAGVSRVLTSVGVEEANIRVIIEGVSVTVEEAAVPVEYILPGPGERRKNELRLAILFSERSSAGVSLTYAFERGLSEPELSGVINSFDGISPENGSSGCFGPDSGC